MSTFFRLRGRDATVLVAEEEGSLLGCVLVTDSRRFYEKRGWQLDGRRGTGKFPPYPVVLGYSRAHQDDRV